MPVEVVFQTKPEIALDQIRAACAAGLPRGVVLMDAGYGTHIDLRTAITALELAYVAGILSNTTVWAPGTGPLPPKPYVPGRGRPTNQLRRDAKHRPVKVKDLAFSLPPKAWRTITWREGTNAPLKSRFARLRIRIAHRDFNRSQPWPEEWLLIEWPKGEQEPTKCRLSTLRGTYWLRPSGRSDKVRWRIERDYPELKQEVGLGHFEGRCWRGFQHHATLCIAAYGFLISERETIPLSTSLYRSPATCRSRRLSTERCSAHCGLSEHQPDAIAAGEAASHAAIKTLRRCPCCGDDIAPRPWVVIPAYDAVSLLLAAD